MNNKPLTITFPKGFISSLQRRYNGAKHTFEEIKKAKKRLDKLYKKYLKNKKKLDYLLDVEWNEKKIESHFRESIWYNAHRRRERYEKNKLDAHRMMFYILTNFDGNGRECFDRYNSISAEDIMYDFESKYSNKKDTNE